MRDPVNLRTLGAARAMLGEGIRYDAGTDNFTWLDIPASQGWLVTPDGAEQALNLGSEVAFACWSDDGRILAGGAGGLTIHGAAVSGGSGWLNPEEVLNDGAVHPSGRFLVFGSRDRDEARPSGHMWLLGDRLVRLPWRFTVFNGPAFSPDGTCIYFADSPARTIYAAPVDAATQTIGDREVFAMVPDTLGYPDGMACDDAGGLWSAHWDGGCLTRYTPDGIVDFHTALPVRRPTSLAFRGATLAITSAALDDASSTNFDGRVLTLSVAQTGPASPRISPSVLNALSKEARHGQ